jgi:hypothetical protein
MMDPLDADRPDLPYYGLFIGYIVNNQDPENLGRVRVCIPGLIPEDPGSAWAFPLGAPGAGPNRGLFSVPPEGADVGVFFNQGNPDQPYFLPGWHAMPNGISDAPQDAKEYGIKAKTLETDRYVTTWNDSETTPFFQVRDKLTGDSIKMDSLQRTIDLEATAGVSIKSQGLVQIEGLVVTVNGIPAGQGKL